MHDQFKNWSPMCHPCVEQFSPYVLFGFWLIFTQAHRSPAVCSFARSVCFLLVFICLFAARR